MTSDEDNSNHNIGNTDKSEVDTIDHTRENQLSCIINDSTTDTTITINTIEIDHKNTDNNNNNNNNISDTNNVYIVNKVNNNDDTNNSKKNGDSDDVVNKNDSSSQDINTTTDKKDKQDEGGGGQGSTVETLSENNNNGPTEEKGISIDIFNTDNIPTETKEIDQTTTTTMMMISTINEIEQKEQHQEAEEIFAPELRYNINTEHDNAFITKEEINQAIQNNNDNALHQNQNEIIAQHGNIITNNEKDNINSVHKTIQTMPYEVTETMRTIMPTESEIESSIVFEDHRLEEQQQKQSSIAPSAQLLQHAIREENETGKDNRGSHETENIVNTNIAPQENNNASMKQVEDEQKVQVTQHQVTQHQATQHQATQHQVTQHQVTQYQVTQHQVAEESHEKPQEENHNMLQIQNTMLQQQQLQHQPSEQFTIEAVKLTPTSTTLPIASSTTPTQLQSQETQINARDVLCGRGGGTNNHPGNRHFREIVCAYQPQYIASKKRDKKIIAAKVVEVVRKSGGRFLQKVNDIQWMDIGDKKAVEKTSQALREGMDVRHKKVIVGAQEGAHTTMQQTSADLHHQQQHHQFAHQNVHSDTVNTFMPSSTTAQHMIVPNTQNLVATNTLDAQQQQDLIYSSALPSMQTIVAQSSQLNTVATASAQPNVVPSGLSTQSAVTPSSDLTTQAMATAPPNLQNTYHELTTSPSITTFQTSPSSQANPYFIPQNQTENWLPCELPPPPHLCVICGSPETTTRPLCFFPPNLLIHAFCGTLAASQPFNKPEYELLHLKGIKHKYRHDETLLKLLPAALSRTRSAMNTTNKTRLYMVRDLQMHMQELRELQINNGGEVAHVVHSHITVAGTGKRGRGRPRKGEIVLPKVKRPRGRPPKDPEKLVSTTI